MKYTQLLTTSREGVNLTPEEHERLDHIVRDGIARGLSPYQIICHNGGEEGLAIVLMLSLWLILLMASICSIFSILLLLLYESFHKERVF